MHVVDDLVVTLVILASVLYALLALGPRALRARLLAGGGALLLRLPRFAGLSGLGQRLGAAARGKAQGACGGCDSCGSAAPAAVGTAGDASVAGPTGAAAPAAVAEVRIPLSRIGRRQAR